MEASYHDGMSTLAGDDIAGICAMYPPSDFDRDTCNPIPRHGFSPRCAARQTEGRCSVGAAPGRGEGGGLPATVLLLVGLGAVRRRAGRG